MEHTGNIECIPPDYVWQDKVGLTTLQLSKLVGNRRLYVNLDTVPPGAHSTKYHTHSTQEEFFYVLSGTGTLRLNAEEQPVAAGHFLGKPAGTGIAHTFRNTGAEPLVILDIGTVDGEDTCYYPDEDVYLHRMNDQRHAYRAGNVPEGFSSLPIG